MIRTAVIKDIAALIELENLCFDTDRISRRSFRHLLTKGNASAFVYDINEAGKKIIAGYAVVLFHTGTSLARLYSIAVHPDHRGRHIGEKLLSEAERIAIEHECVYLRLEVRKDNGTSINLYRKFRYKQIGIIPEYYEDKMEALRFEKFLHPDSSPDLKPVQYYRQTLEFTCGPAALMMAMHALDPSIALDRKTELRIWREATSIFMTSGHGGCGPYGMALAAYRRGFNIDLYVNQREIFFIDSVRDPGKKEVITLVQKDFIEQVSALPVTVIRHGITADEIEAVNSENEIAVVLISSYRIYREKAPHWVVVTGFDSKYIYCHDPYSDDDSGISPLDRISMPILKKDFKKMAKYGKSGQKAALILRKK
ncbi:MAG: GNAT family N-acetyltransferase/peptidase C39 family protein [Spirochaetes bacterium]|nr:GNAT family N-acetyltransferase/peptidase C39 family protein [Spirochaetota bacterium]